MNITRECGARYVRMSMRPRRSGSMPRPSHWLKVTSPRRGEVDAHRQMRGGGGAIRESEQVESHLTRSLRCASASTSPLWGEVKEPPLPKFIMFHGPKYGMAAFRNNRMPVRG